MNNLFDLSKFNSYKEDNRREVKKASGGYLFLYGKLTLQWQIHTAV